MPAKNPTPMSAVEKAHSAPKPDPQVAQAKVKQGDGDLDALFAQGDTWDVR